MKKNGLFASLVRGVVEEEKQKYADRPPEPFMNEKKQLWYFLMNQIDGPDATADSTADDASDDTAEETGTVPQQEQN